jgi:cytoskeletal protein CcmA (bactofilin family)
MFNFDKTNLGRSVEKFESIVGATLKVEGDLVISKSLRIDGTVHGNILQAEGASATVAIASGASVLGNIAVHDVIVSGHLRGNITSPGRVELIDTAKVEGDVTYGSIGVAVGARIAGQLKQIDDLSQIEAHSAISKAAKFSTQRD